MLQELKAIQDRFEPLLQEGYYTFIGPVDQKLFASFMRQVNDIAPVVANSRELHHFMGNKQAVELALQLYPPNLPLRIYVVNVTEQPILLHDTIEGYCKRHGLNFTP